MTSNPILEAALVKLLQKRFATGGLVPAEIEQVKRIQSALGREVIRFVPTLLPAWTTVEVDVFVRRRMAQ